MPDCSTEALHCVSCGRPSDLMQGALSACCAARVTRKTTCDGKHPVYEVQPGATDGDVDNVLVPHLLDLARSLVAGGRQPDQAVDDLGRAVEILRTQLARERALEVERTGQLPG